MKAIDREKLLGWIDQEIGSIEVGGNDLRILLNLKDRVQSGAFDIKPPEVPAFKPGDRVRHKTERALILGEITGFSKTGKSAFVKWIDYDKKVYWFDSPGTTYRIDKLEKVGDETHD